jgi:type IV pilus assembly protein PilF
MKQKRVLIVGMLAAVLLAGCASQAERQAEQAKQQKLIAIHTELGATYLARNQLDVAQQELERALELGPDDSQANHIMGLLQLRLKNEKKAEQYLKRAIEENPDNSDAHNSYGVFLCERGRLDEADKQFRDALRNPLYREPQQANVNAGLCRIKVSDWPAAANYFRAALKIDPRLPSALVNMARVSLEMGQPLSARAFIQRFFAVAGDTPESLLLAFRIERALGAKDAQATYAVRLRGKFPDSAEAKQLRTLTGR